MAADTAETVGWGLNDSGLESWKLDPELRAGSRQRIDKGSEKD